jgi:hypothetical protein
MCGFYFRHSGTDRRTGNFHSRIVMASYRICGVILTAARAADLDLHERPEFLCCVVINIRPLPLEIRAGAC